MTPLHHTLDALIEVIAEQLSDANPDGEYATEALIEQVEAAYTVADVAALTHAAVVSRVQARDRRQGDLARSSSQATLGGGFSPPEGEFALGDGKRIPKAKAKNRHWIIRIQLETEHINHAQQAHSETVREYAAYAPYLQNPAVETSAAQEQYHRDNPGARPGASAA